MKVSSVFSHGLLLAYISATSGSVSISEVPVSTSETPSKSRWFGGWWSSDKSKTTAEPITSETLVSTEQVLSVELPSEETVTVSNTEQPPSQEAGSTWASYNPLSYFWGRSTEQTETKTEASERKDEAAVETTETFDFATEEEAKAKKTLALVPKKRAVNPSLGSLVSHFESDTSDPVPPSKRDKKSAKRRQLLRSTTSLKDAISLGATSILGSQLSMMDALAESRINSVLLASQSEELLRRKAAYQTRTRLEEHEIAKQRGRNSNVMGALMARLEQKKLALDDASTEAERSVTEKKERVPVKKEQKPQPRKLKDAHHRPANVSEEGSAPKVRRWVKPVPSEGGQDGFLAELKARVKDSK